MTKIVLLADTHLGARNDNPHYSRYFYKFYDEVFFPYLEQNNIKDIIHLGDVLDRRKFVNFKTLSDFNNKFVKRLEPYNVDIIVGNHDTYYKNTNEINAPTELLSENPIFKIYDKPEVVYKHDLRFLYLPWVTPQNIDDTTMMLEQEKADIVMGHLEIKGFEMHKGHFSDVGLEKSFFSRFEKVLSGHFHKKSDDGQIYYLGTQYEITWADYKCRKGFHIFDTETRELTRVENPYRIHKKILYNDKETDYTNYDISGFDKCFIKLFITNKNDEEMYNKFVERLYSEIDVHNLQIIDDIADIHVSVSDDVVEKSEDTLTFLRNYIDQIETDLDKSKLKKYAQNIYNEVNE